MKLNIFLVTVAGFLVTDYSWAAPVTDYVKTVEGTANLVGYWRFSPQSQANSEVNAYTGTLKNGAAVGPASSGPPLAIDPDNTAVVLNGSTSYVSTSLTGQIDGQGSIIGWFKLATLPSTAGHIFYLAGESQFNNDFDTEIETDNVLRFYTSAGGRPEGTTPFTAADVNMWHFFAGTFVGNGDRNIYIDGNLAASAIVGGHALNSAGFNIGESEVFTGRVFGGQLDEIAVFSRALTATEVADIYASRLLLPEPSCIALVGSGLFATILSPRQRERRRRTR